MSYQIEFENFWKELEKAVEEERFAKLTMAKTIGKPNLRNIFIRPTHADDEVKVLLKKRYRSRDTDDIEVKISLEEAKEIIASHLRDPFWSVIMFSTTKDLTFKINKKGAGSLVEALPTFSEVVLGEMD